MEAEALATLLEVIGSNPGTIAAAVLPQAAAIIAAWIKIEKRLARIETIIDMHLARTTAAGLIPPATVSEIKPPRAHNQ